MSSFASYMQANPNHDPDPRFENIPGFSDGNDFIQSQVSNNDPNSPKKFRLNLSQRLHKTAVTAFITYLILLIAFSSPYWLSSHKFTDSAFKRLGLWDFCFQDYRHTAYQYDTKFTGCHWIYSPVYTNIRDWLQPPWFMFVQAVTTISLCVSTLGLLAVSIIFMHYLIQYQLVILSFTLLCHMFTTMLISFAVVTFYGKAFDSSWIMYPNFNYLDWAFYFALVSAIGNGYVSVMYYHELKDLKHRMLKMKRLIVATSNGRSIQGDLDSLDAAYAARSVSSYNQSMGQHDNQTNRNVSQQQHQQALQTGAKDTALMYPHFTQV